MRRKLRDAIERVVREADGIDDPVFQEAVTGLRESFEEVIVGGITETETGSRLEFIEDCLKDGMSKMDAAKALVKHDPRVSLGTAKNLVYTTFSGMYQVQSRKSTKRSPNDALDPIQRPAIVASDDDEELI